MPKEVSEWKRGTEGILVFLVGMIVGTIIVAPPGVAFASGFPSGSTFAGWVVCAFGLALLRPTWAAAGVGLSWPTFTMVITAIEIAEDPTANNLWPIGLVIVLALTVPPALVGAVAGWFLRRFVTHKTLMAMILVAAGAFIAVRPAVLTSRQISMQVSTNEASALSQVTAILEAQRDYQSQDPNGRYACHFDELNQTFERRESSSRFSDAGWANGYHFELSCRHGSPNTFHLSASPESRGRSGRLPTGLTVYCTDATGQVLSLPALPRRNCWREGEPLSSR